MEQHREYLTRSRLRAIAGEQLANTLMSQYGQRRIPGVSEFETARVERDRKMIEYFDRTNDYEATAAEFALSPRQVRRRLNGR